MQGFLLSKSFVYGFVYFEIHSRNIGKMIGSIFISKETKACSHGEGKEKYEINDCI